MSEWVRDRKVFVAGLHSGVVLSCDVRDRISAGMEPEELFETVSQCLLAGFDRDCVSGWGANVYIM